MSESKTSKRRLEAIETQRQALELRRSGMSYPAIAEQLGYAGPAGAFKAVESALQRTLQEPADEVRRIELDRLDFMLRKTWEWVENGEPKAIDRALRIMERRARYLGLDAPQTVNVQHILLEEATRLAEEQGLDKDAVIEAAREILAGRG